MKAIIKNWEIELTAIAVSVLLSIWLLYFDNVINDDGVLYLKSAQRIADGNWREAVQIYHWPFYSAAIAMTQWLLRVDFDVAAYVLNTALYAALIWVFLAIVRTLGGSRRELLIAAAFILALPSLNSYRVFVIRDIVFWALYLSGLLAFCKYQLDPRLRFALACGASMSVATLFRIEGLVFLLGLPFAVLFSRGTNFRIAFARFVQLNLIPIGAAVAVATWLSFYGKTFVGRLYDPLIFVEMATGQLSGGLEERASALAKHVLNRYTEDLALEGMLLLLMLILVSHVAKGIGLLGAFGAAYAWCKKEPSKNADVRRAIGWAIVLNVLVLVVFLTAQFFITGRYVVTLTLTLSLLVPFGLSRIYAAWMGRGDGLTRRRRMAVGLISVLYVAMVVDSVWSFGVSKNYLKEAGLWLRSETAANARILSQSAVVGYYADKDGDEWRRYQPALEEVMQVKNGLDRYDYVVVALGRKDQTPETLRSIPALREFRNAKNDRVLIFRASDLRHAWRVGSGQRGSTGLT